MAEFLEALFVVFVAVSLLVILIPVGVLALFAFYKEDRNEDWDN